MLENYFVANDTKAETMKKKSAKSDHVIIRNSYTINGT